MLTASIDYIGKRVAGTWIAYLANKVVFFLATYPIDGKLMCVESPFRSRQLFFFILVLLCNSVAQQRFIYWLTG